MELLKPLTLRQQEKQETASLALKALLEQLGQDWRGEILDLGAAVSANMEFFSEHCSNLYVADVFRTLETKQLDWTDTEIDWDPVFEEILPYQDGTRYRVVLAWDVLNYLKPRQIESLSRRIGRFSAAGTVLFALISTRKEIPARPRSYHILSPERLLYQTRTQAIRPCPLYREPELRRVLTGFEVRSTFLLRNGMHEFLFTYAG